MQYSWLEKLTEEGQIRAEVKDRIYDDCSHLLNKLGSAGTALQRTFTDMLKPLGKFKSWAQREPLAANLALQGGALAFGGLVSGIAKVLGNEKDFKTIIQNRIDISQDPSVGHYKEKAGARFDEIVKVAPRVAVNKPLSQKLVFDRLHSGFTAQDYESLANVQAAHAAASKKTMSHTDVQKFGKRYEEFLEKNQMAKKSSISLDKLGKIYADVLAITQVSGIDKVAAEGFVGDMLKTLGIAAGLGLATGVGAGTVNYINSRASARQLKEDLDKSFQEAMKRSSPSEEPLHANKEKARQAFDTLVHFAPNVALEPSAARGFMNSMIRYNLGTDPGVVKELSEIERNISSIKEDHPFTKGFQTATEMTGLAKSLSQTTGTMASERYKSKR